MEEIGYHPNLAAKSLVSKMTKTLGLILPRPAEELFLNLFFSEFIRGIVSKATRDGYDVLMTSGASEREEMEAIKRLVKGKRVDGIVLLSSRKEDPLVAYLHKEQFPFILIGRSMDFSDILSIDNDNEQASYDATRHLIELGHKRIGFVSGPPNLVVSHDRLEGYKRALKEHGLEMRPEWIVEGEFLQESGYRAMSYIMGIPERPTALVVIDDLVAYGVLRGLNELGYRVPEDVSLISFNNIAISALTTPPLTSIDIGIYQMGYMAAQALVRKVTTDRDYAERIIIPHRLELRESTYPLK